MKILFDHIQKRIPSNPTIGDVSEKLIQLGHEHEIEDRVLDFEFTPNRGDCLSIKGILRDLNVFYDVDLNFDEYLGEIGNLSLNFTNNAKSQCSKISFLKIDVKDVKSFSGDIETFFANLEINKNNFFTDISNYISYEMGQPLHCYDSKKIDLPFCLDLINGNFNFKTLLDKDIKLSEDNLVFRNDKEIINLAGIIGGKSTACDDNTKSVIVECASFKPEAIIGKTIKYDIKSEAAHKFERGTDQMSHHNVLRRYLKLVDQYSTIQNAQIFSETFEEFNQVQIPFDVKQINKILGTNISTESFSKNLERLGFEISQKSIMVPSYRKDVSSQNDIAEEIARVLGYDFIDSKEIIFSSPPKNVSKSIKSSIKNLLIDNGFSEVINYPFVLNYINEKNIKVDNPLDSNKAYLRTSLKSSLIDNLVFNERRQKDSIKLFEVSDLYSLPDTSKKETFLGVIASGRVDKNYRDFSKKIDENYIYDILKEYIPKSEIKFEIISRESIGSKSKNLIIFFEIKLSSIKECILEYSNVVNLPKSFKKYEPISEYPSSNRDLSFSVSSPDRLEELDKIISSFKHKLLRDLFIFDFYNDERTQQIKVAYRFVFQSTERTITDDEVNEVMNKIISSAIEIESVTVPGLKQ